jgi:hypothetical protein
LKGIIFLLKPATVSLRTPTTYNIVADVTPRVIR